MYNKIDFSKIKIRFSKEKRKAIYNDYVVNAMIPHCSKVTIVTGFYDIDYKQYLHDFSNVHIIYNDKHELGMFSSIKKAINEGLEVGLLFKSDNNDYTMPTSTQLSRSLTLA